MLEKEVEAHLREQVRGLGGTAYKFISPGNSGVPDRIVVFPGPRIFFVELKSEKGELTALQHRQQERLTKYGCSVWTLRGKGGVDDFIAYCRDMLGVRV